MLRRDTAQEVGSTHDHDPLVAAERQHVATVAADDVCRSADDGAFKQLVIVGISADAVECIGDRHG